MQFFRPKKNYEIKKNDAIHDKVKVELAEK